MNKALFYVIKTRQRRQSRTKRGVAVQMGDPGPPPEFTVVRLTPTDHATPRPYPPSRQAAAPVTVDTEWKLRLVDTNEFLWSVNNECESSVQLRYLISVMINLPHM